MKTNRSETFLKNVSNLSKLYVFDKAGFSGTYSSVFKSCSIALVHQFDGF